MHNSEDDSRSRTSTKYLEAANAMDQFGSTGYMSLMAPNYPQTPRKKWPKLWNIVVVALFVVALFISALLLGYYVRHTNIKDLPKKPHRICLKPPRADKSGARHLELLHENLMYTMNGDKQAAYLRNYAAKQVYSGSESDRQLTKLLRLYFDKFGFDNAGIKKINDKYDVLLSMPDVNKPNEVHMLSPTGEILYSDETLKLPEEGDIKGFIDQPANANSEEKEQTVTVAVGGTTTSGDEDDQITTENLTTTSSSTSTSNATNEEKNRDKRETRWLLETEDMDNELLDLNDDSITPELIERLKKMGSAPMPVPIPDLPPFVAYSPPGEVTSGVVFVGYGGPEEYGVLQKEEMPMQDRIAIARIGNQTIREKVRQAQGHGIVGLLLYMDPADDFITPFKGCDDTIALWANANDDGKGDPLTPNYPSIDGIVRLDIRESIVPKIPIQTVSCKFARQILSAMTGLKAPSSWVGALNITYYAGSMDGGNPFKVRMSVHNHFTRQPIHNVIATITGEEEPDKYIVIGANRNSFALGPFGGVFGTAGLVELARNLGILILREHWRPKRTIILCSWGGGDYGNIGLIEHLQEFGKVLPGRIVTYINLDQPVLGNYSLRVVSSPTLQNIIYNAAQRVPSPDDQQSMLYDTWYDRSVETTDDFQPAVWDLMDPRRMALPDPFFALLGVPSTHIQYMPRNNKAFDISIISDEIHHHWRYHNTVNRMSSLLMLSLVDADIVQYDIQAMARKLQFRVTNWLSDNDLVTNSTHTELVKACNNLIEASSAMREFILHNADFDIPSEKRLINERLVGSENIMSKAFLHVEILSIKMAVVNKLSAAGAELPKKKQETQRKLSELQTKKRKIAAQRSTLRRQLPETREKQQKGRQLLRQQQDLSKPIRALREQLFKIEQQELSLKILSVTIFSKNDFSELLHGLQSAKQVLRTEL